MTRTYNYPSSAFVGFERLFDELNKVNTPSQPSYPPHNIVKISDEEYAIEMAVAGISTDNLDIEIKDNTLTVSYQPEKIEREYVYRGISSKKFVKSFTLHEYVIVDSATAEDGILTIALKVEVPEEKKPRKINIAGKKQLLQE
jgi:molecular chaperone IbpA